MNGTTDRKAAAPAKETAANAQTRGQNTISNERFNQKSEKVLMRSDRWLARAEDAGRQLIRSWCDFRPREVNTLHPSTFPGILAEVAERTLAAFDAGAEDFAGVFASFIGAEQGLIDELVECNQGNGPLPQNCAPLLETLREYDRERCKDILAARLIAAIERGEDPEPILAGYHEAAKAPDPGIAAILAERSFDFEEHPEKPVPVFTIAEHPLATAGNLMNVQAPPKAGKSAVIEAMIAAVMNGNRQGPDTLGFAAENPQGLALIHFDTEQSRFDHDGLIRRACRRARVERPPEWFTSYSVADLGIHERREALRYALATQGAKRGGVLAVMVDGIGDLCADPNDSEEAFGLVHELHALAIKHHCAIATVLHENPGSEGGKTRGHLGSQLERKAETNLRLAKDAAGITTIWAEKARHCYLPKDAGPCFAWNPAERMHTSCGTAGEIKSAANRDRMRADAERAFGDVESYRHGELLKAIENALDILERAAKERVRKWAAEGIIRKDAAGKYHLTEP